LVSPQSFPHLWKKLWKFSRFFVLSRFGPSRIAVFPGAKALEPGIFGLLLATLFVIRIDRSTWVQAKTPDAR
jgi:hypothetical protein